MNFSEPEDILEAAERLIRSGRIQEGLVEIYSNSGIYFRAGYWEEYNTLLEKYCRVSRSLDSLLAILTATVAYASKFSNRQLVLKCAKETAKREGETDPNLFIGLE